MEYDTHEHVLQTIEQRIICFDNSLTDIKYIDYRSWENERLEVIKRLFEFAHALDKVSKRTGIAKAVAGGVTIVGGLAAVAGVLLIPVSGGASLALTAAGTTAALGAGVTTFMTSLVELGWNIKKTKEAKLLTKKHSKTSEHLAEKIKSVSTAAVNLQNVVHNYPNEAIAVIKGLIGGVKKVKSGVHHGNQIVQIVHITHIVHFLNELNPRLALDFAYFNAVHFAEPGLKIFGHSLVSCGTHMAHTIAKITAVVTIIVGIWRVISAGKQIKKGSKTAAKFRQAANEYNNQMWSIHNYYMEISQNLPRTLRVTHHCGTHRTHGDY